MYCLSGDRGITNKCTLFRKISPIKCIIAANQPERDYLSILIVFFVNSTAYSFSNGIGTFSYFGVAPFPSDAHLTALAMTRIISLL